MYGDNQADERAARRLRRQRTRNAETHAHAREGPIPARATALRRITPPDRPPVAALAASRGPAPVPGNHDQDRVPGVSPTQGGIGPIVSGGPTGTSNRQMYKRYQ
jgi:hypothetical protein